MRPSSLVASLCGIVFPLGILFAFVQEPAKTRAPGGWITYWMDYGYGYGADDFKLAPRRSPLDHIEDDLVKIQRTLKEEREDGRLKLNPVVVPIGKWGRYEVVDVIDEANHMKEILLRFPSGEYRVLRSLRVDEITGSSQMPRSFLLQIQGQTILVSEVWIYRRDRANDYFLLEPHTQVPTPLDQSAITDGIHKLVPHSGVAFDAYPKFDIRNLSCTVWLETSGPGTRYGRGRVTMRFKLEGTRLAMVDGTYDANAH